MARYNREWKEGWFPFAMFADLFVLGDPFVGYGIFPEVMSESNLATPPKWP